MVEELRLLDGEAALDAAGLRDGVTPDGVATVDELVSALYERVEGTSAEEWEVDDAVWGLHDTWCPIHYDERWELLHSIPASLDLSVSNWAGGESTMNGLSGAAVLALATELSAPWLCLPSSVGDLYDLDDVAVSAFVDMWDGWKGTVRELLSSVLAVTR